MYYLPDVYYKNDLLNDKNFKIHNTKEEQEEYYVKWESGCYQIREKISILIP